MADHLALLQSKDLQLTVIYLPQDFHEPSTCCLLIFRMCGPCIQSVPLKHYLGSLRWLIAVRSKAVILLSGTWKVLNTGLLFFCLEFSSFQTSIGTGLRKETFGTCNTMNLRTCYAVMATCWTRRWSPRK